MTHERNIITIRTVRGVVLTLLTCLTCTGVSGCLLAAAGAAGAGAGYIAGQQSDKHETVVVHEDDHGTVTEHHAD
ncbi:MAG TPA: hypothetical protein VHD56_08250 [Tepidisphaeraceae bacterium]|nr:hypothetical protein [Tepidisphaeraceae bacterium]